MQPQVHILTGDCREKMRELPPKSVHTVVTSPPYWALRDYGVDGQIGLERSITQFIETMVTVFQEVYRVLRDDGTCWVNLGDTYQDKQLLGIPWRVALALSGQSVAGCYQLNRCPKCHDPNFDVTAPNGGFSSDWHNVCHRCGHDALGNTWDKTPWLLRSDIIWHKPNPVPEPNRGRPTLAHEYLFLLTKKSKYFYDNDAIREPAGDEPDWDAYEKSLGSNVGADSHRWSKGYKKMSHNQIHPNGRQKRSVWTIPTKGFPGAHFATFPPALVKPCILAGTSEKGCCANCGAPKKRVSENTPEYQEKLGKSWHDHQADKVVGQRGIPSAFRGAAARMTVGWEATCGCNAEFVPCTVLDPFGGSGTTGEVALQLGRSATLIELNPEYVKLIEQRTAQLRLGLLA